MMIGSQYFQSIPIFSVDTVPVYTVFILSPTRCDFDIVHDTVMFTLSC
jgi:hypothetical protein